VCPFFIGKSLSEEFMLIYEKFIAEAEKMKKNTTQNANVAAIRNQNQKLMKEKELLMRSLQVLKHYSFFFHHFGRVRPYFFL
jgi:hypothetical protein